MSAVVTHQFEFIPILTFFQEGTPWFVLSGVAEAAGIEWGESVASRLDEDDYRFAELKTSEGRRWVTVVSLAGLFAVIRLSGERTNADRFKSWINTMVLPSILSQASATLLSQPSRRGLHTTTEIAGSLGIHPNTLGKRVQHLKTPRYGELCPVVASNTEAVVSQWWWNEAGRTAVLRFFGKQTVAAWA
jgi:prophage antirepressor-like protein